MKSNFVMLTLALALGGLFFLHFGEAQAAAPPTKKRNDPLKIETTEEPGIQVDHKSFSQIFESNLTESQTKINEGRSKYDMEFSFVGNSISSSALANDYYVLDLAEQAPDASMVKVYGSFEVLDRNGFFVSPLVGLGYSFQENTVMATSKKGGSYRDVVRVQWAPIFAGAKAGYRFSQLKGASAIVRSSLSYDWISVAGNLDGITQSYWAPSFSVGVGGNFFESDRADLDKWFGGVSLTGGVTQPLSGNQGFASNWVEVGMRVLL
jgi:hypothetical protein